MKTLFTAHSFLRSFAIIAVLLSCTEKLAAQTRQVSVCEQLNNTAISFIKLVDDAREKENSKTLTEADKIALAKEFQRIEAVFSNPTTLPEYIAFNRYLLIRSTVSYYNFLYKLKDYQQITGLGKKAFTYPDGLKAENCTCDIKGYRTIQRAVIDEEFGDYVATKEVPATVATMKVTPKNLYELSDALLSIVALAAHRTKNYEQRDQFFNKTFKQGYLDWGDNVMPYTISLAILKTYTEGQPVKDVELCAAITYLNVLRSRTPEQLKDNSKTDSAACVLAKNIIVKTCGDELNPITSLDPTIYARALITFLQEKTVSSAAKATMVKANFNFLINATSGFSANWTFNYDYIFRAFSQDITAAILTNPDATFVNGFIDYVNRYKASCLKPNVNGQLVYDIYLYCKAKKDKRAKAIYKWIEYSKDTYPTFVK